MVEERLRQELEASFRNRADRYRLMHAELTAELGLERGDQGLFEAAGVQFANQTWSALRGGGCA